MFLPTPEPAPPGGAPVRRAVVARRATVDGSTGRLQVAFPMRDRDHLVRRMVIQGPGGTVARIYVGDPSDDLNLADATTNGQSDIADNIQPLYVPAATTLYVVWTTTGGSNTTDPDHLTMARIELEDV
jgi:hypothetical protein